MMLAGPNGAIPLRIFSSIELTELRFILNFGEDHFSNWSVQELMPQSVSVVLQEVNERAVRLAITPTTGNTLSGVADVALLRFYALPQSNSIAAPVQISSVTLTPANGASNPTLLTTHGNVKIAGPAPLLTSH